MVALLQRDIAASGYIMTLLTIIALAVAIAALRSSDRIIVVPVPAVQLPPAPGPVDFGKPPARQADGIT